MTRRISTAALALAGLLAGCRDGVLPKPEASDTVAPTVQVAQPGGAGGPNSRYINTTRAKLAGTLADDQQVVRASYQLNGGAEQPIAIQAGASAAYEAALELPVRDDNALVVHAYDAAGNRGSSDVFLMTVDTVAPPAPEVSAPREGVTYSAATPGGPLAVAGTAQAFMVGFSLNGAPAVRTFFGRSACSFKCFEHTLYQLKQGDNVLSVYTYDLAGNEGVTTVRFRWYDVPAVQVTSPNPGTLTVSNGTLRVTGSASHTQQVARLAWQANDGAEQELAGAGGATASFDFTATLREGPNEIRINAYNPVGLKTTAVVQALRPRPASTPGAWASVSTGTNSGCGLTTAARAYCWGLYGPDWSAVREHPLPEAVPGSVTFASVTAGNFFACGIDRAGAAYCWGINEKGRLGTGSAAPQANPTPVAGGHRFAQLTAGPSFVCGTTTDGAAYCWGEGFDGQLGNGASGPGTESAVPVAVAGGRRFREVQAGVSHACGITAEGEVFCWGNNSLSQLGNASYTASATPVAVAGGRTFAALAVGGLTGCALDASGAAYCWGGLRAPGTITGSPPTLMPGGLSYRSITVGYDHACALTAAGAAHCWGRNTHGQLGNGAATRDISADPAAVAGGLSFARITAGYEFTCGILANGASYCWGQGTQGKLGNGTRVSSAVPVRVADPS